MEIKTLQVKVSILDVEQYAKLVQAIAENFDDCPAQVQEAALDLVKKNGSNEE